MTPDQWQYVVYGVIVVVWVGLLALTRLYLKSFFGRVLISLTPIAIAGAIVTFAWVQYSQGKGGFRLGTDLVGGTILVYEIDEARSAKALANDQNLANELAVRLKRRIDPNDLKNVIVRPVSNGHRVEVILPTGGAHQAEIEERNWLTLIDEVKQQWPELKDANINVQQGRDAELVRFIADHTNAKTDQQIQDIRSFVASHYNPQTNYTENQIQDVKDRISQVGSM
ncbi:MAG TPA: hypothetical protein VFA18_05720, partial [Gemmataceae bacterium]|nr:hypothetical protein [Gemmataceae bacterium]